MSPSSGIKKKRVSSLVHLCPSVWQGNYKSNDRLPKSISRKWLLYINKKVEEKTAKGKVTRKHQLNETNEEATYANHVYVFFCGSIQQ